MNSELVLGGDYYVGDLVVGQEQRVGTIKINGTTYNRYVKIVDCGVLPNVDAKNVVHGITGVVGFLNIKGTAVSGTTTVTIPRVSVTNVSYTIDVYVTDTHIRLTTGFDYSSFTALVTLEYYK